MPTERPCALCESERRQLLHRGSAGRLEVRTVICLDCGLVYAHPMYSEDEKLTAEGGDPSELHTPGAREGRVHPSHERRVGRYVDALGDALGSARTLLDIGCGDGALLREATSRGLQAVGVEGGVRNAATARAVSGAEVIQGHFEGVSLDGRSFDLITCVHVLEHVVDPLPFLRKARSLLGAGGRLFIEVPNVLRPQMSLRRAFPLAHNYHLSPETLVAMLRRAGLSPLRRRTYRRGVVSALAAGGVPQAPQPNPRRAAEVLRQLQRYRWAYYASLRFAWRKLPSVRRREFYSFEEEQLS
jgi:SAM-dependent methyltransferase